MSSLSTATPSSSALSVMSRWSFLVLLLLLLLSCSASVEARRRSQHHGLRGNSSARQQEQQQYQQLSTLQERGRRRTAKGQDSFEKMLDTLSNRQQIFVHDCVENLTDVSVTGDGLISQDDYFSFLSNFCLQHNMFHGDTCPTTDFYQLNFNLQAAFVTFICDYDHGVSDKAVLEQCIADLRSDHVPGGDYGYVYTPETQFQVTEEVQDVCIEILAYLDDWWPEADDLGDDPGMPGDDTTTAAPIDVTIGDLVTTETPTVTPTATSPTESPTSLTMTPTVEDLTKTGSGVVQVYDESGNLIGLGDVDTDGTMGNGVVLDVVNPDDANNSLANDGGGGGGSEILAPGAIAAIVVVSTLLMLLLGLAFVRREHERKKYSSFAVSSPHDYKLGPNHQGGIRRLVCLPSEGGNMYQSHTNSSAILLDSSLSSNKDGLEHDIIGDESIMSDENNSHMLDFKSTGEHTGGSVKSASSSPPRHAAAALGVAADPAKTKSLVQFDHTAAGAIALYRRTGGESMGDPGAEPHSDVGSISSWSGDGNPHPSGEGVIVSGTEVVLGGTKNSNRSALDMAIETAQWSEVARIAMDMASCSEDMSGMQINHRTGSVHGVASSSESGIDPSTANSNGLMSPRDEARAAALDEMIEVGDWNGVAMAANGYAQEEEEVASRTSASSTSSARSFIDFVTGRRLGATARNHRFVLSDSSTTDLSHVTTASGALGAAPISNEGAAGAGTAAGAAGGVVYLLGRNDTDDTQSSHDSMLFEDEAADENFKMSPKGEPIVVGEGASPRNGEELLGASPPGVAATVASSVAGGSRVVSMSEPSVVAASAAAAAAVAMTTNDVVDDNPSSSSFQTQGVRTPGSSQPRWRKFLGGGLLRRGGNGSAAAIAAASSPISRSRRRADGGGGWGDQGSYYSTTSGEAPPIRNINETESLDDCGQNVSMISGSEASFDTGPILPPPPMIERSMDMDDSRSHDSGSLRTRLERAVRQCDWTQVEFLSKQIETHSPSASERTPKKQKSFVRSVRKSPRDYMAAWKKVPESRADDSTTDNSVVSLRCQLEKAVKKEDWEAVELFSDKLIAASPSRSVVGIAPHPSHASPNAASLSSTSIKVRTSAKSMVLHEDEKVSSGKQLSVRAADSRRPHPLTPPGVARRRAESSSPDSIKIQTMERLMQKENWKGVTALAGVYDLESSYEASASISSSSNPIARLIPRNTVSDSMEDENESASETAANDMEIQSPPRNTRSGWSDMAAASASIRRVLVTEDNYDFGATERAILMIKKSKSSDGDDHEEVDEFGKEDDQADAAKQPPSMSTPYDLDKVTTLKTSNLGALSPSATAVLVSGRMGKPDETSASVAKEFEQMIQVGDWQQLASAASRTPPKGSMARYTMSAADDAAGPPPPGAADTTSAAATVTPPRVIAGKPPPPLLSGTWVGADGDEVLLDPLAGTRADEEDDGADSIISGRSV